MEADLSIRTGELAEVTVAQLEKLSDEELFAYMKAGYHDALAIVFRRYQKMVFRIARGILRDAGEAEDLMQAVFLELFQAVGKFDPSKGTSKGWIIRYAYHRSLNRKKYLKARAFYGQEEIENGNGRGFQVAATPVVTLGLKEQEARRLIQQSLATLNKAQRKHPPAPLVNWADLKGPLGAHQDRAAFRILGHVSHAKAPSAKLGTP